MQDVSHLAHRAKYHSTNNSCRTQVSETGTRKGWEGFRIAEPKRVRSARARA